jgi:hypothetical protein
MLREIAYGLFWLMRMSGGCFSDRKVQCLGVIPCLVE